ncbi:diacylglycerol kinase family protein [Synechococcus sp. R5-16]|jgi:diacylglycerol kinase (ATP)|uniref:diacylglycerol kinase family protein n=1 Tax=unclassified Synechococcus TaxID=2626047 RepID=UPI0039C440C9
MANSPSRLPERSRLAVFRRRVHSRDPAQPSEADRAASAEPLGRDPWRRPPSWQVADNLGKSFYYAGKGLVYAIRTQRNFRIHMAVAVIAFGLGLGLQLSALEMAVISLTSGLVMALELVNTALEAVVDLTLGSKYHLLAEIAKDCAAAAVLMAAVASLMVAAWLFLPPLVLLLQDGFPAAG